MSEQPSLDAMKAAVELEIENAIGCVTTRSIGALIDKVADARVAAARDITQAAGDVLAERHRQIITEVWTVAHDDKHTDGALALAAACYAKHAAAPPSVRDQLGQGFPPALWPWLDSWWKPTDRRRDLVKAGALILAEIERLDRASA